MVDTEYPDFKCARPVERAAMARKPIVYRRQSILDAWSLLWLTFGLLVGLVLGHAIYLKWLA